MKTYRSNGKLLLTGEYVVLDGALALALPTTFGQDLTVESNESSKLIWTSIDHSGNVWFEAMFDIDMILSKAPLKNPDAVSQRLIQILRAALTQNPNFISLDEGLTVTTQLEFNKSWGLGTSSTLINNIASWARIDAYQLLKDTFGGSGYDIACAQYNSPILYQVNSAQPQIEPINFRPNFTEQLYFVYLNQKQDSRKGIANYKALKKADKKSIERVTSITKDILNCEDLDTFQGLLRAHEQTISELIAQEPIKNQLFSDFSGAIKSLGAWGGDFILVTSANDPTDYFETKGYKTIFRYSDLILA